MDENKVGVSFGPRVKYSSFPGADAEGNFIVVEYTFWNDQWMWRVNSWSPTRGYVEIVNDNGTLWMKIGADWEDNPVWAQI